MKKNVAPYDIFISYRRDNGWDTAKHLRDILTARGYSVFFDVDSLRSGDFNRALLDVIENCTDFIIILSPNALDRCVNERDWVRQELACALKAGKNVIPVISGKFHFPEKLPEDINAVRWKNAITVSIEFFDAMVEKLISFLHSRPRKKAIPRWLLPAALVCVAAIAAVFFLQARGKPPAAQNPLPDAIQEETAAVPASESVPDALPAGTAADQTEEHPATAETIQPESGEIKHIWGDYVPEGTAAILTKDGSEYTAIANSLVRQARGIEPSRSAANLYSGYDNPSEDSEYLAKDMVYFKDMASLVRTDDAFTVTDRSGNAKEVKLLTDASLLFIGTQDNGTALEVREKDIVSIHFDWSAVPDTDVRYCRITQTDGSFTAPTALFWLLVNRNEGTGKPPSMMLSRELTPYSDRQIDIRDLERIEITKNPTDAEFGESAEDYQTKMTVYLKAGDQIDITTSKFIVFYAKAKNGLMHSLNNSRLSEIVFY